MSLITTSSSLSEYSNEEEYEDEYFETYTGEEVPTDGHSTEWMEELQENIVDWLHSPGNSPSSGLTDEQIEYIYDNMEDSLDLLSETLTRVERGVHFEDHDYNVGDQIQDEATFRSFSRSQEASLNYIRETFIDGDGITIYKTEGSVGHFDVTRFDDTFIEEEESFVDIQSLTIKNVVMIDDDDEMVRHRQFLDAIGLDDMAVEESHINIIPEYIRVVEVGE